MKQHMKELAILSSALLIIFIVSTLYYAKNLQTQSEKFWGDYYSDNPDFNRNVYQSIIDRIILPHGGPLIDSTRYNVCFGESIRLVPARINKDKIEVLCGYDKTIVEPVRIINKNEKSKLYDFLIKSLDHVKQSRKNLTFSPQVYGEIAV